MMTENILAKLFEHNNWANLQIVQACSVLSDAQLDAQPQSATKGSIRSTLIHFVNSQRGYLALLTLPVEARPTTHVAFAELKESVTASGDALLAFVKDEGKIPKARLQTRDSHYVEPWVVLVQVINHATEHREQIKSMLSALGVTPPEIDGWSHGESANALVAMPK
jgi:uncharacterized damage-inducible protein DinB